MLEMMAGVKKLNAEKRKIEEILLEEAERELADMEKEFF